MLTTALDKRISQFAEYVKLRRFEYGNIRVLRNRKSDSNGCYKLTSVVSQVIKGEMKYYLVTELTEVMGLPATTLRS